MQYKLSTCVLIGLAALWLTSCSTQRSLRSEVSSFRFQDSRDTIREKVVVAVHDTIIETKTVTITKNEEGDTTFTSIVTERDRFRGRAAVRDKEEKLIVRTDTVYIERRDSVLVERHQSSAIRHQTSILKWIFAIVCAIIGLIITVKFGLRKVF